MRSMGRRVGVYSGTFDPVHPGHVAFALEALRVCKLDEVVFLPEPIPRFKHDVTNIKHRTALVEHAITGEQGLRVVRLASEQFSVQETLPELGGLFGDAHFTFLFGSDVARSLAGWPGIDLLLKDASLAIAMRNNDGADEIGQVINELSRTHNVFVDYTLIRTADCDIASSQIRNGTADLSRLHPTILDYIQAHSLYPGRAATGE